MLHGKMIRRSFALALLVAVCPGSWAQSPPKPTPIWPKPSRHSGPPVLAEFQSNEVESAQDQVHRKMREERYGKLLLGPLQDPGNLVGGTSETTSLTYIDYINVGVSSDPHGIPVSQSSAVVIATVLSGKCHINGDHDYVYTDYQIKIDEILKQDPATILTVGEQLVASKPGGAIHFPSGHVTNVLISGHGLAAIGSQYVLFLTKSIPSFPEYDIVFASGYELKNGHIFPLDDMNMEYENMVSSEFLDLTRKAIATGGQS
jgi:hypothetical protein